MRWLLIASSPWIGLVAFGNDALFNLVLGESVAGRRIFGGNVRVSRRVVHHHQLDGSPARRGRPAGHKSQGRDGGGSQFRRGPLGSARRGGSLTLAVLLQSGALVLSYLGFIWICYGIAGWPRSAFVKSLLRGVCRWGFDLRVPGRTWGWFCPRPVCFSWARYPLCQSRLSF